MRQWSEYSELVFFLFWEVFSSFPLPPQSIGFLRAKAECFARLSHRLGVCLSIRLSVCHTRDLYQNGASLDHEIFTVGCPKVTS